MVRLSQIKDQEQIKKIMLACFGEREESRWKENLPGRYLVYEENGIVVAMTGLYWSNEYGGFEIDWTGTLPEYRHKGYMQELFRRLTSLTDEDIYCSCWRIHDNEYVNLHHLMEMYGFKEVVKPRVTMDTKYNCSKNQNTCVSCLENHCRCYEDLYVRKLVD